MTAIPGKLLQEKHTATTLNISAKYEDSGDKIKYFKEYLDIIYKEHGPVCSVEADGQEVMSMTSANVVEQQGPKTKCFYETWGGNIVIVQNILPAFS